MPTVSGTAAGGSPGGPITGGKVVPCSLAKLTSKWSHARGGRQQANCRFVGPEQRRLVAGVLLALAWRPSRRRTAVTEHPNAATVLSPTGLWPRRSVPPIRRCVGYPVGGHRRYAQVTLWRGRSGSSPGTSTEAVDPAGVPSEAAGPIRTGARLGFCAIYLS